MAMQTVDVSLNLHPAAVREDACNGLLVLAVDAVVRQSSGELSLEASTSTDRSPQANSARKVQV